jgi:prepilin-type processing-associated H-X9-DG protein
MTFPTPVPSDAAAYAPPAKKGMPVIAIVGIVAAAGCLPVIAILAAILFPVFAQVREKARMTASEMNERILAYATIQYVQDHDEKFPPMDTQAHWKAAIEPYVAATSKRNDLFVEPGTHEEYVPSAELSKKALASIDDPSKAEMILEPAPHSGGKVVVAYADGHVGVVTAETK